MLPGLLVLAGRPAAAPDYPFAVGETLRYEAFLGSLRAGTATLSVARTETDRGARVFVLTMDGGSRSRMLAARYAMTSWVGADRFTSRRFHRRADVAGRVTDERFRIVPDSLRYRLEGSRQDWVTPPEPLDELALLYRLRSLPLRAGASFALRGYFKNGYNPLRVTVTGREPVRLASGESVDCFALRITAAGAMSRVWITDDARRLPAQVELGLPVGRVRVVLGGRGTRG